MKRESIEAIRARLLAEPQVHSMIEIRAYDIYTLRGGAPGREAEDWLQAEAEILKFLIDEEGQKEQEAPTPPSMAHGVSEGFATPAKPDPEPPATALSGATEQLRQPEYEAVPTELASSLGLADFLTDRIPGIEPEVAPVEGHPLRAQRTRSRVVTSKPTGSRKDAAEKTSRAKASAKKSGEKKAGKKPKKS